MAVKHFFLTLRRFFSSIRDLADFFIKNYFFFLTALLHYVIMFDAVIVGNYAILPYIIGKIFFPKLPLFFPARGSEPRRLFRTGP